MRRLFFILLATTILSFAGLEDPGIDRKEIRDNSSMTVLVENGTPKATIVFPSTNENCAYAASELQEFIRRSTGAKLPIVNKSDDSSTTRIFLGIAPEGLDLKSLPRDAFIIRTIGKDIYIAGRDAWPFCPVSKQQTTGCLFYRGTLYGVYGFLERFLGARLVFPIPECEYVKKMDTLSIPKVDIIDRPDKTMRSISWTHGWNGMPKNSALINNCRLRMQTTYVPNCHGLGRLGYIERFGEKHPEYFALRPNGTRSNSLSERMGGQLCFSSGVVDEIYQDVKAYLTGVSAKDRGVYIARYKNYVWDWNAAFNGYFNVMPQDGMLKCQCDKCKAAREKDPDWDSEFVWQMTADFARRLKAEGVKGEVTQMAYAYLSKVPKCDIPENIPVQLAIQGSWGWAMPGNFANQIKQLDDWNAKLGHKVYLWTYECKYSGRNIPNIPCSTPIAVAQFYKAISHGTFGGFMESESDKAVFQALNWYIFSKMMWDESLDGEKEFAALCDDFFGPAAPQMQQFFSIIEKLWLEKICANCVMTDTGPKQTSPSQRELWSQIYSPETLDKLAKCVADAKAAVNGDNETIARIAFWEREYLGSLRKSAEEFHSIQQAKNLLDIFIPEATPTLDGKLSDTAWKTAPTLHLQPLGGKELQVHSFAKVLRDNESLYIAMRCEEPMMAERHVLHMDHDDGEIWTTDSVEIFLAPDTMPGQYIQLMVNPKNSLADLLATPAKKKHDYSYESKTELHCYEGEDFWSVELKIPLSALANPKKISADFAHSRTHKSNPSLTRYHAWSPFSRSYGDMENFGTLLFTKPDSKDMIVNGDFSAPQNGRFFGPWSSDDKSIKDGSVALDDKQFIIGGRSMRIINDGTKAICLAHYFKEIEPDTNYRVTCFLKIQPAEGPAKSGGALFMFNDGVNHTLPANGSIKTEMPWTRFSFDVKSRKEVKAPFYLRIYSLNFNGTVWYDAITMEKLP